MSDAKSNVAYVGDAHHSVHFYLGEVVDDWKTKQARLAGDKNVVVKNQAVFVTKESIVDGVPDPSKINRPVTPRDIAVYPQQWALFVKANPQVNPDSGRIIGQAKPKFRLHDKMFQNGRGDLVRGQTIERVA